MPATVQEWTFTWENNKVFHVEIKEGAETKTLIQMDENGDIASLWSDVTGIVEKTTKALMARILDEMRGP